MLTFVQRTFPIWVGKRQHISPAEADGKLAANSATAPVRWFAEADGKLAPPSGYKGCQAQRSGHGANVMPVLPVHVHVHIHAYARMCCAYASHSVLISAKARLGGSSHTYNTTAPDAYARPVVENGVRRRAEDRPCRNARWAVRNVV